MMHVVRQSILVVTLLQLTCLSSSGFADEIVSSEDVVAPKSWLDYLNATNTLGSWVGEGKTQAMWEGVPAGLEYSLIQTRKLAEDGTRIQIRHRMETVDGKVISSGGGDLAWDDQAGKIVFTGSGFDTGKPYFGTAVLVGLDPSNRRELWKHTETSRGITAEYHMEVATDGGNQFIERWQKVGEDDEWTLELSRQNPLADITRLYDISGTWNRMSAGGGQVVVTARLTLDGRALMVDEAIKKDDGSLEPRSGYVMSWDPLTKNVVIRGLNRQGFTWNAQMVSLTVDGDAVTMVSSFSGASDQGGTVRGTMTRVLTGDTLTQKVTDVVFSNRRDVPPWVGVEMKLSRVTE